MRKFGVFIFVLLVLFFSPSVLAYDLAKDSYIYVGGQSIGIKLNCGVTVVGTYGIYVDGEIYKPWENTIMENDTIINYDNCEINSISDLLNTIKQNKGKESEVTILRGNEIVKQKISPVKDGTTYSLGLYIKDSIMGVGTLTYYIKEANIYGSLGHQIGNNNLNTGYIYEATVDSIVYPSRNQAGEKKATIVGKSVGEITINSSTGVQGYTKSNFDSSKMKYLQFKTQDEINLGDAEIWTVVSGEEVKRFKIKITSLEKQKTNSIKGISFEVVDEELISSCGGIIQGMSGSPIVQDNKLIGAVTHVSVADAKKAYGIYIEWMFEDMGVTITK